MEFGAVGQNSHGQPLKGKPFPKGKTGNPGGRPKALKDVVELARQQTPAAIAGLAEVLKSKRAPAAARVSAASVLLDRAWGKAKQSIEHDIGKGLADLIAASMRG